MTLGLKLLDLKLLDLEPGDADWALAKSVHAEFSNKPGAEHIASDFALAHLSAFVKAIRPTSILEIGAGIGTVTRLLLRHDAHPQRIVSTEDNPFCLEQFAANIVRDAPLHHELVTDQGALNPETDQFDLVVIDASMQERLYGVLRRGTYCFVEGSRSKTRDAINDHLMARGLQWDWVNFNRGTRWFRIARGFDVNGKPYRKIRLRKPIKGCWVGQVVAKKK